MRKPFYIVSENFINQLEYDPNDFRVKKIENLFCEESERSSMVKDSNKGIESISYNHLNLPTKITWANNKSITYAYNAAGQKISKSVRENNDSIKAVEYLDGFQYAGKVLQFFPHPEGYVKVTAISAGRGLPTSDFAFNYVFNYTDHLGNVRLSYTKDPQTGTLEILDENHYYPFGLKHGIYAAGNLKDFTLNGAIDTPILEQVRKTEYQYKYNGKELQDELGLNWYDYGARNYDAAIGRFAVIDPKALEFMTQTPYAYAANNPVFFEETDGMNPVPAWVVRTIVTTVIKVMTKKTLSNKIKNTERAIRENESKIRELDSDIANIRNPSSKNETSLFGGGSFSGGGATGSWGPKMTKEESRQAEIEREKKMSPEERKNNEKIKQLEKKKEELEKQNEGLEQKIKSYEYTKELVSATDPDKIAETLIENGVSLIDMPAAAEEKVKEDVHRRDRELKKKEDTKKSDD